MTARRKGKSGPWPKRPQLAWALLDEQGAFVSPPQNDYRIEVFRDYESASDASARGERPVRVEIVVVEERPR